MLRTVGYLEGMVSRNHFGSALALSRDGSTLVAGAQNEGGGLSPGRGAVYVFARGESGWLLQARLAAQNGELGEEFGRSVALSVGGDTLAVLAPGECQTDDIEGGEYCGAVYVFIRSGETWYQQAHLTAANLGASTGFRDSVALSAGGDTLAVGSKEAVYILNRRGGTWSQQAFLTPSDPEGFGTSVVLSGAGDTLAVSASGAVRVFSREGETWSHQAYIKASNSEAGDAFGSSIALNDVGEMLAVGAPGEDSAATGIAGDELDNSAQFAGAVYLFTHSSAGWTQRVYIKASNADASDHFGSNVACSAAGDTLAVSAPGEASSALGIGGNQLDNSAQFAGAVYVFTMTDAAWSQLAYVKTSRSGPNESSFGSPIALSADGNTLASAVIAGIGSEIGAVYLY
jgi:hypothetical protein